MGQKLSIAEQRELKNEIYAYYPGLEQQLEMTFICHDLESAGTLPYTTLEPILRHLLMQYGLIEYVTRFSNSDGSLDQRHISHQLSLFGLSSHVNSVFSCDKFKSLATIWLRKILETYADDQVEWQEKISKEREEQAAAYMAAMDEYQKKYSTQQAMFQQGLMEQQKQIAEWSKLLEDTRRTQQQVYEAEVRRMEEIKLKEQNAAADASREEQRIIEEYMLQLKNSAASDENSVCFVYPACSTPHGACASAGAQEPYRRKRKPKTNEGNKAVKEIC